MEKHQQNCTRQLMEKKVSEAEVVMNTSSSEIC